MRRRGGNTLEQVIHRNEIRPNGQHDHGKGKGEEFYDDSSGGGFVALVGRRRHGKEVIYGCDNVHGHRRAGA